MYTVDELAAELKSQYPEYGDMDNQTLVNNAIKLRPELRASVSMEAPEVEKYSTSELAAEIKAQYPEYEDMDDETLVDNAIKLRPELKDQWKGPSLLEKGKELVGGAASAIGNIAKKSVGAAQGLVKSFNPPQDVPDVPEQDRSVESIEGTLKAQPAPASTTAIDTRTRLSVPEEKLPEATIGPAIGKVEQKKEEDFAVPSTTAIPTEPEEVTEKKLMAVAESETPLEAGLKEAGLALTYSKSPVSPYRKTEHPAAAITGQIAGTLAPMIAGGTGIIKTMSAVPKFAQLAKAGKAGKAAFDGIARMTTATMDYLARNNDQLFSEDNEVRGEAIKNMVINMAAAGASPAPEQFLPRGLIQPVAQGATDLLVETVGQAFAGDNAFSRENLVNTIASTIMGATFGLADIKGVDVKSKNVINTMQKAVKTADPEPESVRPLGVAVSKEQIEQVESRAKAAIEGTKGDTENIQRLPGEERVGKEPVETKPVEITGEEEAPAGGVFQAKKQVADVPGEQTVKEPVVSQPAPANENILTFKSEGMKDADEQISAKVPEAQMEQKKAGEAGFLKLPGEEVAPEGGVKKVGETLEAGRFAPLSAPAKIAQYIGGTVQSIKDNFTRYESKLDEFPQYKDNKRTQFVPMRRALFNAVAKYRKGSLGKVVAKDGKKGIRAATDILLLRNLKLRGQKGQTLENNLTVDEVTKHLDWLEKTASSEVIEAANDMRTIMRGIGEELVARGKLTAESLEEDYFPHKVLEYLPDFMQKMATPMNRKFGEPYRPYTKKALGSKRIIASDDSVIWTHIAKVLADNAQEDWFTRQAIKYDATNKITPEQRKKLYKGAEVDIDGKKYKALEWKKVRYRVKALNENMLEKALAKDMLVKDWLDTKGPKGGEPVREAIATGKPQMYLLPKEIAQDLDNMIEKSPAVFDLIYRAGHITQKWKGFTLGTAFLPYQVGNAIGDAINVAIFDPFAMTYLPKATRVAAKMFYPNSIGKKVNLSETEQKLYDVATEKDVASSGMTAELRMGPVKGILEKYNTASEYRESLMRLSVLAHQLDRISQGKDVQNLAAIDLNGLDPESAAGKVSREVLIDYLAIPRSYQLFLSRGLMPFVRFHEGNFRNYGRAVSKNKGTHRALNTLTPIVSAYAAQWAYNNLDEDRKEMEMQLPDYMRERFHINLGKTSDGNIKIWAPQQPVDMAMSWLGLDKLNRISSDLKDKRITPKQAAEEFVGAAGTGAVENIQTLMNPFIQMWQGLSTNEDPFTHRQIMPKSIHKQGVFSKYGKKYALEYMMEKIITPVAQYTRTKRGDEPLEHPILDYLKNGPVNVPKAFGFYDIDPITQDLSEHFKVAGPIDAASDYYRVKFYDILDEYGDDILNGLKATQSGTALTDNQQKAVAKIESLTQSAKDNGFTGLAYGSWISNLTAQRKIIDAELRKTTDQAKRRELRTRKKELLSGTQAQYMKQVPKTGRERYVKEMKQRKALP